MTALNNFSQLHGGFDKKTTNCLQFAGAEENQAADSSHVNNNNIIKDIYRVPFSMGPRRYLQSQS